MQARSKKLNRLMRFSPRALENKTDAILVSRRLSNKRQAGEYLAEAAQRASCAGPGRLPITIMPRRPTPPTPELVLMAETLKTFASLLRSLVMLALLGLVSAAGWFGYQAVTWRSTLEAELQKRDAEVGRLSGQVAEQTQQIEQLDLSLRLLKRDHRLARISVLDQHETPDKKLMTKIRFVELDDENRPIDKPRDFTLEGDVVYVEAWIVKYLDQHVEKGDPARGTSICLFKRLYGEFQEPSAGFALDSARSRPAAYSNGAEMPEFEREIWERFWDYANEPDKAQRAGIRAAHGEAPFVKLRPGKSYLIDLRASDGLTIRTEETPPAEEKPL
jgi:hypothetical protein